MIIVIAGIKRSGSTVQYNLVRIALEMAGYKVHICGHGYKPRKVPEGEVDLVKRHKFSKRIAEAADHIFLTDREDEEIIASLTRFNGKPPYEGRIEDMRKHLDKWREYTNIKYEFKYWQWPEKANLWAWSITDTIGLNIDPESIIEEFNKIRLPKSGQDKKTLMFYNHITSV